MSPMPEASRIPVPFINVKAMFQTSVLRICVYTCIYTCILFVCTYTNICTYTYIHTHTRMQTHVYSNMKHINQSRIFQSRALGCSDAPLPWILAGHRAWETDVPVRPSHAERAALCEVAT